MTVLQRVQLSQAFTAFLKAKEAEDMIVGNGRLSLLAQFGVEVSAAYHMYVVDCGGESVGTVGRQVLRNMTLNGMHRYARCWGTSLCWTCVRCSAGARTSSSRSPSRRGLQPAWAVTSLIATIHLHIVQTTQPSRRSLSPTETAQPAIEVSTL